MEIVLLNPNHDSFPLDLGLTYFILFAKSDDFFEKTSPNIKIDHFFDGEKLSSNKKQGSPFDTPFDKDSFFDKMKNSQFKKDRFIFLIIKQLLFKFISFQVSRRYQSIKSQKRK